MTDKDLSITHTIFQLIWRVIFGTIIHEGGHLRGAALVGVPMAYYSYDFNHVYWLDVAATPEQKLIISLMGGLLAGVYFLGCNVDQEDWENNIANIFNAVTHFAYSIGEALLPSIYWDHSMLIAVLIAGGAVSFIMLSKKPNIVIM